MPDIQPGLDVNSYLAAKQEALLPKNCSQFGLHVLVLSDIDSQYQIVYAIIQVNLFFEVQSKIQAVDVCLKVSYIFGLHYPAPVKSWTFIQKFVFGITSEMTMPVSHCQNYCNTSTRRRGLLTENLLES